MFSNIFLDPTIFLEGSKNFIAPQFFWTNIVLDSTLILWFLFFTKNFEPKTF